MVFFLVCFAAYTGYTDADYNLDCVVDGVVAAVVAGGDGGIRCLPAMCETTLHALVGVTL